MNGRSMRLSQSSQTTNCHTCLKSSQKYLATEVLTIKLPAMPTRLPRLMALFMLFFFNQVVRANLVYCGAN